MIVTLCLNPALDVTYRVDALVPGTSHRVREVEVRAGGKGTNVASVLWLLGERSSLVVPLAGGTGAEFAALVDPRIEVVAVELAGGATRRTVTVVDDSSATVLNEPGPGIGADWNAVVDAYSARLASARVAVLAGSCPPGTPADAYAELIAIARGAGVATVLDADGDALLAGLAAEPTVAKVNAAEAQAATGLADPVAAAHALRGLGARTAIVTRGRDGLVAVSATDALTAWVPVDVPGNPTGAGDALTAVLADGLARGRQLREIVPAAVATSAAAVAVPHAGGYDAELAARLLTQVEISEVAT